MPKKAVLHLVNEFAPVLAFFVAAQVVDSFFVATGVYMVATILALYAGWYFERRFPILPIVAGVFILISGAITLFYQAPDALILADTIYYLLMGLVILAGQVFFKFNLLQRIFASTFAMHDAGWAVLARRWIVIFILAGLANEVARQFLTPEAWVNFKLLKVVTVGVFGFYQFTVSKKYRIIEQSNQWGLRTSDK